MTEVTEPLYLNVTGNPIQTYFNTLDLHVQFIRDVLATDPVAKLEWDNDCYECGGQFPSAITYHRPETEEEREKRLERQAKAAVARTKRMAKQLAKQTEKERKQEEADRKELERLIKMYGLPTSEE